MQVVESEITDGRVVRRLENRARIVDALFELMLEGLPHPTLREVAERAGVTARTLLNHFADTDALHAAASSRARELAAERLPPVPELTPVDARVREWFRRAAEYYDGYAAVRWAALTFPTDVKQQERRKQERATLHLLERRVTALLEPADKSQAREAEFTRALRAAIDPIAWRLLRTHQGLSRSDAASVMARNVLSLAHYVVSPKVR